MNVEHILPPEPATGPDCPISILPREVLELVFELCIPFKQWRAVALSTTKLWSSLQIDHTGNSQSVLSILLTWASRAAPAPLSIHLPFLHNSNWAPPTYVILDYLTRYCQQIEVSLSQDALLWNSDWQAIELPLLRSFAVRVEQGWTEAANHRLATALQTASSLQQLSWTSKEHFAALPEIPWAGLSYVRIQADFSSPDDFARLLVRCRNAERIILKSSHGISFDHCLHLSPWQHPTLTYLSLSSLANVNPLFDVVTLPALEYLDLYFALGMGIVPWSQHSFQAFVKRSGCSLISLCLFFPPISTEGLINCITTVEDTLRELTVQNPNSSGQFLHLVTDSVLDLLTPHGDAGDLVMCPRLESLAIYDSLGCPGGAFTRMLRSRFAAPPSVSRLKLLEIYEHDPEFTTELQDLAVANRFVLRAYDDYGYSIDVESGIQLSALIDSGMIYSATFDSGSDWYSRQSVNP